MLQSENDINFYLPVQDTNKDIVDFRIVQFNNLTTELFQPNGEKASGKLLPGAHSHVGDKQGIEFLKETLLANKPLTFLSNYHQEGMDTDLAITLRPTPHGLLATAMDSNDNREYRKELDVSHKQLKAQIFELENERYFSQGVLDASNNIILFFLPLKDDKGNIIDFKIEYVNNTLTEAIGKEKTRAMGRKISEFYPNAFVNGDFKILTDCFYSGENIEITKPFKISGKNYWFAYKLVKLNEGILVFAKNITREREYEEELALRNRISNRAEVLAKMGSYKWNIDTNVLICSNNFYRLFGHEPGDLEMTLRKFLGFVHPEDRNRVRNYVQRHVEKKKRLDLVYRIISKDHTVKTIHGTGDFYTKKDDLIMVGALLDITEGMRIEQDLRAKNRELTKSNSELESFNRVASHDLQEPLRKIQMFISRIEDRDDGKLSERSKKFLEKINSSSERMRELIQNLLSYSKVGDQKEDFEIVDLNGALQKVLQEFAERIEEAKAKIETEKLPSIYGIEFQLEQLLGNLVSNALKYRNEGVPPKIKISSKIVPFSAVDPKLELASSPYLVLSIQDNGIGFENQYAFQIFDLFQRLHPKNEFSGTGLGLAICKKIVENHQGYIEAEGIPGQGSKFTVYLPYPA